MPVTLPATSDVNFTPSWTEEGSPESIVGGVAEPKIVFGAVDGVTAFEALDGGPSPIALLAVTLNV